MCLTLCDPMDCSKLGFSVHHHPPELAQTHVHRVSDAIQPSHSLSPLLFLPSIFSSIESFPVSQFFTSSSQSIRVSASNEYSGLIPFRIDWFDLVVQGTLKSLLQHHSLKASILWCSAFFTVQLSHPYMTIGKTVALTIWTFVSKVISLLFSMLSRLVSLLRRSKRLLISWISHHLQ